jgi:hypothetical protein
MAGGQVRVMGIVWRSVACAALALFAASCDRYPPQAVPAVAPRLPSGAPSFQAVVLGDSITHAADSVPWRRWIEQVVRPDAVLSSVGTTRGNGPRWLWDWTHEKYRSTDYLQPGALDHLPARVDLLVLAIGATDLVWSTPQEYRWGMAVILARLPADACTVVFPWDWRINPHPALPFYRESARAVAEQYRCRWVDLTAVWPLAPAELAPDGIHPNGAGHDAIARVVVK